MHRKTFLILSMLLLSVGSLFLFKAPTASAKGNTSRAITAPIAYVGPGIANCGTTTYVATAFEPLSTNTVTTIANYNVSYHSLTDLAAACFNGSAYLAFVDPVTDHVLVCSIDTAGATIHCIDTREVSQGKPGLAVANNQLYLAWAGIDGHIAFKQSQDGVTWVNQVVTTDYTVIGQGVGLTSDGDITIYVSWLSATGARYIHLGTYQGTSILGLRLIFTDYSQSTPAISYLPFRGVEFLFRGGTSNNLHTSVYDGGQYSASTLWSDTTAFSPALSGIDSDYISDVAPLRAPTYDSGKFFSWPEMPG
jgi:hypothetical protein